MGTRNAGNSCSEEAGCGDETPTMVAWAVRVGRRLLDTVVKLSSSGAERAVVEATPRGSAEGVESRAAAVVATALRVVAVTEAETDGWVKWRAVLQGGKPPREALPDDESEPNDDPLPGDGSRGRFGMAPVACMGCD